MQIRLRAIGISLKLSAKKKETSIGINRTSMATNIRNALPEYQIMREREANTAVSSVDITLTHAQAGEMRNVKSAR